MADAGTLVVDTAAAGRELAARLGPVGLWTMQHEFQPYAAVAENVAWLEKLGYPALWSIDAFGREPLTQAALLLGATERMIIATGCANIWGRDPMSMEAAQRTLCDAYPQRFVLGLGISHAPLVEPRGHRYQQPLTMMEQFLDGMDTAPLHWLASPAGAVRVIGALGPRMLDLAGRRATGALTYLVTPEHTATARDALGPDALLAVEQAVVVTTDRDEARRVGRGHLEFYFGLPLYLQNWKRLGFTDADFEAGGSDRLVDALVLSGDAASIADQIAAHHRAGADHVCLQVFGSDPAGLPREAWEQLAAAVL